MPSTVYTTTVALKPAPGTAGDLFLPSDGFTVERDSGAAWIPWGPMFPFVAPVNGDYAWVNQGAASVDATYGGVYLLAPTTGAATHNVRLRVKAAPATPYVITAAFVPLVHRVNTVTNIVGLAFREAATQELKTIGFTQENVTVQYWNDPTAYVGANFTSQSLSALGHLLFLRIEDDGVNRAYAYSIDGQHFHEVFTEGRTDFLTADQVGFFADSNSATLSCGMTLLSWKEA